MVSPVLVIGSHEIYVESQHGQFRQWNRIHFRPDQLVQYFIILFQGMVDFQPEVPGSPCLPVIIGVLALFTAELPVNAPIFYPVSTFQTMMWMVFNNFC